MQVLHDSRQAVHACHEARLFVCIICTYSWRCISNGVILVISGRPWVQVTDCLSEAKRAGAGVLRNPLRAPAHAASRAPVPEQRSGDAPVLRALALAPRAAVQDSGRVGRVGTLTKTLLLLSASCHPGVTSLIVPKSQSMGAHVAAIEHPSTWWLPSPWWQGRVCLTMHDTA